MPHRASYSALNGQSTSRLPIAANDSEDVSDQEHARGADREGLLSGEKNEEEQSPIAGKSKEWLDHVQISNKAIAFSCMGLGGIFLLTLLFHPLSPLSSSSASSASARLHGWYSGNFDKAGVYSADGALEPNPLPEGAKFGDVPFASVGGSWASASAVPEWAGGDAGAAKTESAIKPSEGKNLRWNGTHWFEPTVILISLDGVRADYLERGLTPHLLRISEKGVRAQYLQPQFPSLTFVNHWSIATGLFPASHGIVANDFYDPTTGQEFVYTDPAKSWSPEWWGGEPIWSAAVKNGLRSAVLMWPGPPQMKDGTRPTYFYPFQNNYHFQRKIDRIAGWLDLPLSRRPHVIQAYAPEVDQAGHRSGPDPHSHDLESTLLDMDEFAKGVFDLLQERNLTQLVDVIFVSDHGMTSTDNERLVFLDDILGEEGFAGIEHNEGWPSAGLRFASHIDEADMLARLRNASTSSNGGFNVYTPDDMPERFHYKGNARIPDVYCIPHVGWAISSRHDFHVNMKGDYRPKGNHGYDPADPSMHAIFCAHGPMAEKMKGGSVDGETTVLPGFANTEIFDLVMHLLDIPEEGRPHTNGTRGFWDQYLA